MRIKSILPTLIICCVLLVSCKQQIESYEDYQNPNSPLISLLPNKDDLAGDWRIEKIFSTQISNSSSLADENIEEVAKRYFWVVANGNIHGDLLLHFEVYKFSKFPKIPENIPYTITGSYKLSNSSVEGVSRYENCRLAASQNDFTGCTFVLTKEPLIFVLSIRTQSNSSDIIEKVKSITLSFVEEMEQKLISWDVH